MKNTAPKPVCLVSACLCGVACRYDGRALPVRELAALERRGLLLAVCPEVAGGLSVPRPPCEIQKGRAITQDGQDFTAEYERGAEHALQLARTHGITMAILKEKSPSCGSSSIYDGTFSGKCIPGQGLAAGLLLAHGIKVFTEETFRAELTLLQADLENL